MYHLVLSYVTMNFLCEELHSQLPEFSIQWSVFALPITRAAYIIDQMAYDGSLNIG